MAHAQPSLAQSGPSLEHTPEAHMQRGIAQPQLSDRVVQAVLRVFRLTMGKCTALAQRSNASNDTSTALLSIGTIACAVLVSVLVCSRDPGAPCTHLRPWSPLRPVPFGGW